MLRKIYLKLAVIALPLLSRDVIVYSCFHLITIYDGPQLPETLSPYCLTATISNMCMLNNCLEWDMWVLNELIPRSHSYCLSLSLCLEWYIYNGSITPRVHSGVTKPAQCRTVYATLRPPATGGISVLNNCLEWDKFVRLTLTYPTPDSCLIHLFLGRWRLVV